MHPKSAHLKFGINESCLSKTTVNEKDAASYIGMSVSYLQHARCYGAYKKQTPGPDYLKLGRSVRYRLEDLDKWLQQNIIKHSVQPQY